MEFLLDSANLEAIGEYQEVYPISGVTTNPSILRQDGSVDFFGHCRQIRKRIGAEKSLHVQVTAQDSQGMLAEAEALLRHIDQHVFVKVPVTEEGLRTIRTLKADGVGVTATAIYTKIQGVLAGAAGADFAAPYCNRMEHMGIDAKEVLSHLAFVFADSGCDTKILAASFKNLGQVAGALEHGAHAVTLPPALLRSALAMPAIDQAVNDFYADWEAVFGKGSSILDLVP